jgi:hypothetical protein
MAWWWWVLIWVGLVLAAGTMFAFILLSLWRRGIDLAREIGAAGERFALITEHLERLAPPPAQPAVFDDQAQLRADRERALKLARARNAMRMRQRSELRPAFPAKAQPKAPASPGHHGVG